MRSMVRIRSRILAQNRMVIFTLNNQRAVTSNLVFTAQARFAVSLESSHSRSFRSCNIQLSHGLRTNSSHLPAPVSPGNYLTDDGKMGIFRAIASGWLGCWMVSQFCYCSLPDARADGGIGPRYAGPPEYPDSGGPAKAGPPMIIATFTHGGERNVLISISLRLCSGGMLVPYQAQPGSPPLPRSIHQIGMWVGG